MAIHAFTEYLKYKWRAKARHGTHSPFVYAFVEDVLQDRRNLYKDDKTLPGFEWLEPQYGRLLWRIACYFNYKKLLGLPTPNEPANGIYDLLVLKGETPAQWGKLINKYTHLLTNDSAILVASIHKTAEHTRQWKALCTEPEVRMSIDLYGAGLLFFKEEFKERQHFVLRYNG